ncbi:MAG: hypothetical protein LUD68_00245, partial [Rikenellaceae bacterium]|nr:hypothetical protein [Rikenellaceae bacterium]
VYASQWKNFVRIDDIYETTYVVSCDYADQLITAVREARERWNHTEDLPVDRVNRTETGA